MSRAVYFIGVDHRFQRVGSLGLHQEVTDEFASLLQALAADHQIRGIAEEMSIEGLGMHHGAGGSLPFLAARELGLPHLYCDPSKEIPQRPGIKSDGDREDYWLEQLRSFTAYPCLFVIGATHIASFSRLLRSSGFTALVLYDDWQPATLVEEV
jgi:hypothetical protein